MTSKIIAGKLKEFEATPCHRLFKQLCEALIEDARKRNDTATQEDVLKNQGAISELKGLLKLIKVHEVKRDFDGGYTS